MKRNPYKWTDEEIVQALNHYAWRGVPGLNRHVDVFNGQPSPTPEEFYRAVLEDFDAAVEGETEHLIYDRGVWLWDMVAHRSVRDRIFVARGQQPLGYYGDGKWHDNRFDSVAVAVA